MFSFALANLSHSFNNFNKMKSLKYLVFAFFSMALISCDKEEKTQQPEGELSGLSKAAEVVGDSHVVEIYTPSGKIPVGHNNLRLRFRNKTSNAYETEATVSWMPVMKMMSMDHSCPFGPVTKVNGKETLFSGDVVFQMPSNDMEKWEISFTYNIGGIDYTAVGDINVENTAQKRVNVFKGDDSVRYIVALIEPARPKVGINDLVVGIYKMESMMSYPSVGGLQLMIDPRMPGMGNHGSPNNVNPSYNAATGLYAGKLSLSMTGYWKVNLVLKDGSGNQLKGEQISGSVEGSSIFFEVDF